MLLKIFKKFNKLYQIERIKNIFWLTITLNNNIKINNNIKNRINIIIHAYFFCISVFHLNHLLLYINPFPIPLTLLVVDILAKSFHVIYIRIRIV